MPEQPLVSVIMPVYNAERFLSEAVQSVLSQTFRDYEFIIVNDGSTDASRTILAHYQLQDKRIRLHHHQQNKGVIATLNNAFNRATGTYIAVMSADDISLPVRFERQIDYLNAHHDIGMLGSWVNHIDEYNTIKRVVKYPTEPALVKWTMPFYNPIAQPVLMLRREIGVQLGFYREDQLVVEDYDFVARASAITKVANLPEILLLYRVYGESWSSSNAALQEQNATAIVSNLLLDLLGASNQALAQQLRGLPRDQYPTKVAEGKKLADFLINMQQAFYQKNLLTSKEKYAIAQDVANKLYKLASQTRKYSPLGAMLLLTCAIKVSPPSLYQLGRGLRRLRRNSQA